jgi:ATP-dependent RNA helicase DHX8/PRP22
MDTNTSIVRKSKPHRKKKDSQKLNPTKKNENKSLPIHDFKEKIISELQHHQVVIVVGETGSGKSTKLVQFVEDNREKIFNQNEQKIIACTQPHKVAATSLAKRVSQERKVTLGAQVDVSAGPARKHNKSTRIKFVTDHVLVNELIQDHTLSKYACIVVDEAHERSIHTDLLLGFLKQCINKRPDLKIIISSATLDKKLYSEYFEGCSILNIPASSFPVKIHHQEAKDDYVLAAVNQVKNICNGHNAGDVLVFFAGQDEIERALHLLRGQQRILPLPLHGKLAPHEQEKVFNMAPQGKRKVILATNSAETSISVSGVCFVVDTGMEKESVLDIQHNTYVQRISFITKSSADQRARRAGQTSHGECYRLYSKGNHKKMESVKKPEILRIHLGGTLLKMKRMGISDVATFDFITRPNNEQLDEAIDELQRLEAIDQNGLLTKIGHHMASLPTIPARAKMLVLGISSGCEEDILTIVSMLSVSNNMQWKGNEKEEKELAGILKLKFCHPLGDLFMLLNVFNEYIKQPTQNRFQWCFDNSLNSKSLHCALQIRKELTMAIKKNTSKKTNRLSKLTLPKKEFSESFARRCSLILHHSMVFPKLGIA